MDRKKQLAKPVKSQWDPVVAETTGKSSKFEFLTREELDALPPLEWTVQGVLPETGIAVIYGAPGCGKTFLALDLAAAISNGLPMWFNRFVQQRDVVYVALEGGRGISQRLKAWDKHSGQKADKLYVVNNPLDLLNDDDVDEFVRGISELCSKNSVVFIDTLAQATPGGDENSSQDMGKALAAAKCIAAANDGLVILVHHCGKDSSKGLRGHSSLHGAADAVVEVKADRTGIVRTWSTYKVKDGPDDAKEYFTLDQVEVGCDSFGFNVTSCAVKPLPPHSASKAFRKPPTGKNQKTVLAALIESNNAGSGLDESATIDIAAESLQSVSAKYRKERAMHALEGLVNGGHIKLDNGVYHT